MKKIGIDLDCTLNNLLDVWLERYNKDYNDNVSIIPEWSLLGYVKPECGEKIYNYLHEPGFFQTLDIQQNAYEVVKWMDKNFDTYIVTAYTADTCYDKEQWVKKHLPFFDTNKIIFCNNKGLLNLDYLIDDGSHNVKAFKQKSIIFDYPHNQDLPNKKYPHRAKNWAEVKKILENEKLQYRSCKINKLKI